MQTSKLTDEQVLERFRSIRSWVHGDHRAPHKSLLLLLALAAVQRGDRWLSYADVEPQLKRLLANFGPNRRSLHPEYPFWRLRNDGLWELQDETTLRDTLVALCSFPHLAFDRGALSIDERLRILVSKDVHGQNHVEQLLLTYSGKPLRPHQRGEPAPENTYLDWHRREVFWAPARSFGAERIE